MQKMFYNVTYFNGYLNNWDITENINMRGKFGYASAFNSDVSSWNTSKVTNIAVSNVSGTVTFSQRSTLHENSMHGAIQLSNERFFVSFLLKYIVHS